jgi:hypothetical protein
MLLSLDAEGCQGGCKCAMHTLGLAGWRRYVQFSDVKKFNIEL